MTVKMLTIPKLYIQELQNRKKCQNIGDGSPHSKLCSCKGTGLEPITLIFPAKEVKDWKAGQEISVCSECGEQIDDNNADKHFWECTKEPTISFKILSLERKKLFELKPETILGINLEYKGLKFDEEIILVRC